ncbi:hypothetical protein EV702DRAFT_961417, partial [Suillus placidus]
SLKWTCSQLFLKSRMLRQHRSVNSWNAFVRVKHMEANKGHEKGDRIKLTKFIAENRDQLVHEHSRLTLAEKRALNAKVVEARQQKSHAAHANSKATRHDMNATFTSMDLVSVNVFLGFAIHDLIFDVDQHTITTHPRPLNKLVSDCRTLIQEELGKLLHNIKGKVNMNYTNYERNIVEHYGLALVNWPLSGHVRNPSKVGGRAQVQSLLDALKSRSCEWVRLTDEERVTRMKDNRERHA